MNKKLLSELNIEFTLGKNATRIKDSSEIMYTAEDFENDLHGKNEEIKSNVCVINLIRTKAAPLSIENANKCITSNFLKCTFDEDEIDPWFFCYQFNAGKDIEQQIESNRQGTTLSVKKLNIKSISELEMKLHDIEKQKIIGQLYRQSIIQNDLMKKQVDDIFKLTIETIQKIDED